MKLDMSRTFFGLTPPLGRPYRVNGDGCGRDKGNIGFIRYSYGLNPQLSRFTVGTLCEERHSINIKM